ncbi:MULTISPECIES: ACP S-malonyltransferase [Hallerella]|uniref:Malonyl CoA-acyl carrier protein transacylase n=1 Tax=Hallerella succinigenes TaxID=1896222 RepID=A0A2M9A5H3_9BACT|nr:MULTISPECIES: ACP S-malonyltransferase [Hallerella]MBS7391040.1 ACP S-malonyltransferase [Fibrobacter sp.]MCI6874380.1 ACP S-malonyltransferase [Hallerella sp.]MDY5028144.1 ACP S-malonyltransferase [Hallerella succinigenes]PJJ40898.1 [acyl-carrier-protein] S-malonyltransferase [Hallerella succinigenes]
MSKTIFVFPGQGAQYVGMGKALSESFVPAKQLLEKADDTLGFSISKVMFEGPEEDLKITANTQPALFVSSMMVLEVLKSEGVDFDFVAGHSLGEYSAICAAGGFSFEDGLKLVRLRGSLMAKAGQEHPGSMAAIIGVDDDKIQELCDAVKNVGIVVPANFNCPGQIVVSGEVDAVKALVDNCGAAGVKAVPLAVSGAFHSPLMQSAQAGLADAIANTKFNDLQKPLIANVTAQTVTSGAEIKDLLVRQLVSPVRWNQSMAYAIKELGVTSGVEVGVGHVLAGLQRKIDRAVKFTAVESVEAVQALKA